MLHPVEAACHFAPDMSHGTIVVESDLAEFPRAIDEVNSTEARNLAITAAAQRGMADPRINGNPSGAYPVNSEGCSLYQLRDERGQSLPPQHPKMQIARYRNDILVCRRLV